MLRAWAPISLIWLMGFASSPLGLVLNDDPRLALQEIAKLRSVEMAAAMKSQDPGRFEAVDQKVKALAVSKCAKLALGEVTPADAPAWAEVLETAERFADARTLLYRAINAKPSAAMLFSVQSQLMGVAVKQQDGKTVSEILEVIAPASAGQAVSLGSYYGGTYHYFVLDAVSTERALAIADRVISLLPKLESSVSGVAPKDLGWSWRQAIAAKAAVLNELGRGREAAELIDSIYPKLPSDTYRRTELLADRDRYHLVGLEGPEAIVEAKHGSFKSLKALRGHVVLIEFTAHWCHACHAAIPGLKQLRKEFGDKLKIVAFTTYYGYFGGDRVKERDMPKSREFELMPKLMADKGIDWPMVYVGQKTFSAYGVAGIPHMVVLDKQGVVRRVDNGYSEGKLDRLRKTIQQALDAR